MTIYFDYKCKSNSQNAMLQVNSHRKSCFSQYTTNDLISNLINDIKKVKAGYIPV